MAPEKRQYKPQDTVSTALRGMMITGGAGLAYAAVSNSLTKHNVGSWGIITRTGTPIAIFGTCGGPARNL